MVTEILTKTELLLAEDAEISMQLLPIPVLMRWEQFRTHAIGWAWEYQNNPSNSEALDRLRQIRQQIAVECLELPLDQLQILYITRLKQTLDALNHCGIQHQPLIETEKTLIQEVGDRIAQGFSDAQSIADLFVAILYVQPHQLTWRHQLEQVPDWLIEGYCKFIMQPLVSFGEVDEADCYNDHLNQWIDYLHTQVLTDLDEAFWQQIFVDRPTYPTQINERLQHLCQTYKETKLKHDYRLRQINLLVFPDWHQSEDLLLHDLSSLLANIMTHPQNGQITLLIYCGSLEQETVDDWITSVAMHLLTEEEIAVVDMEPELTLVGQLNALQWQQLLPHLTARISLERENLEAVSQLEQAIVLAGKDPINTYAI